MIHENIFLEDLTRQFRRSPLELNKLLESDAEILRLPAGHEVLLAATTDTLSEELSTGLYGDPFLAGWMVVMATLSDLAAVGAEPLGLLVSEILPAEYDPAALLRLQSGIQEACAACGTFVLGGDTNSGRELILTGCALGILKRGAFMTRKGCAPGDLLYATHPLGAGNAFALSRLSDTPPVPYRPIARLKEGRLLGGFASACMDTSDGVMATLDQLMRINSVGFELIGGWGDLLPAEVAEVSERSGIPLWLFLAGHHGEFELLFTVPPRKEKEMLEAAGHMGWRPVHVGRVSDEAVIRLPLYGRLTSIDTALVRNLAWTAASDVRSYITALVGYDQELRKG